MIPEIFTSIANTINRRPKLIAGFLFTIFIIALFGMTQLTMETGASTYMNQDSQKGILYNKYTDTFQSDSLILIVDASDPLNPDVLDYGPAGGYDTAATECQIREQYCRFPESGQWG